MKRVQLLLEAYNEDEIWDVDKLVSQNVNVHMELLEDEADFTCE